MKSYDFFVRAFLVFAMSGLFLLMACGGTRDDSLFIEEESLSSEKEGAEVITPEEAEAGGQQADEAEVLRLLGITKEEEAQPTEATPAESGNVNLQQEISELTARIAEKDRELQSLRSELSARDRSIFRSRP